MNSIKAVFVVPLLLQIIVGMMTANSGILTDAHQPAAAHWQAAEDSETPILPTDTELPSITPADSNTPTVTETPTPVPPATEEILPTDTESIPSAETLTPMPTGTESETVTPTETIAPTETATTAETGTPTETATPTPTETGTPTETATPTSTQTPEIHLWLPLEPLSEAAVPGGVYRMVWRLEGLNSIPQWHELILEMDLPAGFYPVPDSISFPATEPAGAELSKNAAYLKPTRRFDPEKRELQFTIRLSDIPPNLDSSLPPVYGWVSLLVDWQARGPFSLRASVWKDSKELTFSDIGITDGGLFTLARKGGVVSGLAGMVEVELPENALENPASLRVKPAAPSVVIQPLFLEAGRFEIIATQPDSGNYLYRFLRPAVMRVQYEEDAIGGEESSLSIFQFNAVKEKWIVLPTSVDTVNKLLTAECAGPGTFAIAPLVYTPARPAFELPKDNSGAAVFSFPLPLPGAGGAFQPEAALAYSSRIVDAADSFTQASWAGMGWNLEAAGYIERDIHGTLEFTGDDTFHLVLGNTRHLLLPGPEGTFIAAESPIESMVFDPSQNNWSGADSSGNKYWFEDVSGRMRFPLYAACGGMDQSVTWRWPLKSVLEETGAYWQFEYEVEEKPARKNPRCDAEETSMATASYLRSILYPDGLRRVVFERAARNDYYFDWLSPDSRVFFSRERLAEIRVEEDRDGDQVMETVTQRYAFEFEPDPERRIFPGVFWPYATRKESGSMQSDRGALTLVRVLAYAEDGAQQTVLDAAYEINRLIRVNTWDGVRTEFQYEAEPWHEFQSSGGSIASCRSNLLLGSSNSAGGCYDVGFGLTDLRYIPPPSGVPVDFRLPAGALRPGGVYRLRAYGFGNDLRIIHAGREGEKAFPEAPGGPVVAEVYSALSHETEALAFRLKGAQWELGMLEYADLNTVYRVIRKQITRGGDDALVWEYRYDAPAANPPVPEAESGPPALLYYPAWTNFIGNESVVVTDTEGVSRSTWYYGTHALIGRAARELVSRLLIWDGFQSGWQEGWSMVSPAETAAMVRRDGDTALRLQAGPEEGAFAEILRRTTSGSALDQPDSIRIQFLGEGQAPYQIGIQTGQGDGFRLGIRSLIEEGEPVMELFHRLGETETAVERWRMDPSGGSRWWTVLFRLQPDGVRVLIWQNGEPRIAGSYLIPVTYAAETAEWDLVARTEGVLWLDEYTEERLISAMEFMYTVELLPLAPAFPSAVYPQPALYMPLTMDRFPFLDLLLYRAQAAEPRDLLQ